MAFGSSLHAVLAEYHSPTSDEEATGNAEAASRTNSKGKDLLELETLLHKHWPPAGYTHTDQKESERDFWSALKTLRYYKLSQHVPQGRVLGTEVSLSAFVTVAGHKVEFAGRIDRVELLDDNTLMLLDYKTTRHGELPSRSEMASDLGNFVYFLLGWLRYQAMLRVQCVSLVQLNLASLQRRELRYSEREIFEAKAALHDLVRRVVQGTDFEPRPNPGCARCLFRQDCPAMPCTDLDDIEIA
jgi:hypothetical protein